MERHPWVKSNLHTEEAECLLGELCSTYADEVQLAAQWGYDSINNQVTFELEDAS